ncbi:hypothetical protein Taro_023555, partial [Colocasia esculenta]|nr:hypothetical protein [Colocasia esculenta]
MENTALRSYNDYPVPNTKYVRLLALLIVRQALSKYNSQHGKSRAFAFAVFSDQQSALAAMHTINAVSSSAPCPTLFVANLGPTCSEPELTQAFSRCRGFLKLKMQNKNGVPVAFVDFQDAVCSSEALNHLQGTLLYSSDGEGMRLEY